MARIRSLKPGFFTNEHLCELSPWHRLLFAGLWTLADRDGRLEDRPRRIKAAVFPYDSLDVNDLLIGLAEKGFIIRYVADGVLYLAIPTFTQHQRPKTDEAVSVIPAPILTDPRGISSWPRSYNGQRTEGTGQRTEGSGAEPAPLAADGADDEQEAADGAGAHRRGEDLRERWNQLTELPIPRCRDLTTKRRRQIRSRLTERPLTEWEAVFSRIQDSRFCRGENDRGWCASFDWVIGSPDVGVKVLEGKYDDRRKREEDLGYKPWSCPHQTPCTGGRSMCEQATRLGRPTRPEASA